MSTHRRILNLFGIALAALAALAPLGTASATGVYNHASGTSTAGYLWEIQKSVDQSTLLLSPGQSFDLHYTVVVNATPAAGTGWSVTGQTGFTNVSGDTIHITSVTVQLGASLLTLDLSTCSWDPADLPAGFTTECNYAASGSGVAPTESVATWTFDGGQTLVASEAIAYSGSSTTDFCVNVVDSVQGDLGQICANETPKTVTYTRTITALDATCVEYTVDNTATVKSLEGVDLNSASAQVVVKTPCAGGCSLTPGYWKTHSKYGPAPYDSTWAQVGEDTTFFLSGQTYYQVLWTAPSGNAYYILAHAYIAARLNQLNGADVSVISGALAWAESFFAVYTPSSTLSQSLRSEVISYASILDQYNNGYIGPGHCSQ